MKFPRKFRLGIRINATTVKVVKWLLKKVRKR